MGGEPWIHFTPYEADPKQALKTVRERVFLSKEYRAPYGDDEGQTYASVADLLEACDADGSASILDHDDLSTAPDDFDPESVDGVVVLPRSWVLQWFGTDKPTREQAEDAIDHMEDFGRGTGVCFTCYDGDEPTEICFAGISYD